ncbi:glutaminyl-peptide cyclotransferase isoform X2 [Palaemon carinicauda]|uniref:glutaminyl-peptide cyclotransferase isoform X2 n=1 Tax=Palaemon carinicauda TaxID=392227 RepID=UPI0035B5F33C
MTVILQTTTKMLWKWTCLSALYTLATIVPSSCEVNLEKRSRSLWYKAKEEHQGFGLSNEELRTIAAMSDMNHFRSVLNPIMVPRVVGTANHAKVRKHLIDTMQGLGWTVEEDVFDSNTPVGSKTFTNVIATLDPQAPRHLVLACHYDSKIDREGTFIGATDSAVPCAMMLNLAKVMKPNLMGNKQTQSDLSLQFIFFDGEEAFRSWSKTDSLYGARNLAAKLQNQLYPEVNTDGTNHLHRMDLFVLLDLLGTEDVQFFNYFKNTDRWYARMVSYERRLNDLGLLNKRQLMFKQRSMLNPGIEDDHIPFLQRGVPVVHLIPVPFPRVWHEDSDNATALNYETIQNLNIIMRAFVADYLHLAL